MDVKIVDPCLVPDWDKIVSQFMAADIFHTAEWCQVLKASYNYKPLYFAAIKNKHCQAVIPLVEVKSFMTGNRAISLPFSDYCNFLGADNDSLRALIDRIYDCGQKKKWKYIEFRSIHFIEDALPFKIFFTHDLDLTRSSNELWSGLKDNCRRNIKKATREGVKIEIGKSWSSLEQFYRLQVMTRKRHGLPPQPLKFFKSIYENIISKNLGIIASAHYRHKIIAASVYFNFNHKALFKYGASDDHYHHLRPNNLIMWETINWHRENGCQILNLGRTESDNAGLLNYKRTWGGKESLIHYHRFILRRTNFSERSRVTAGRSVQKAIKWMPRVLLEVMGKALYRHLG